MEVLRVLFTWLVKFSYWGASGLLAIGVTVERSPWWLTGFGLFWLVSLPALGKYRMSWSAIIPHLLCDAYFLYVFSVIVTNKNSSVWWLIVALILEVIFLGHAQEQVEEEEKKRKIARETEKRFLVSKIAEEKENSAGTVKSEDIIKEKKYVPSAQKIEVAKNDSGISTEDRKDDSFWEQKIKEHIRQLKSDENVINRNIGDMLGLSYSDEDPVEGEWKQENFLEIRSKLFHCFGESILKLAQEENIPVKSNKLTGLYADTIFTMAYQGSKCNVIISKIFSLSLYIGTEQAKKTIKVLSEFDKIPATELEKLKKEELKNKNEFPAVWFYCKVKKYASDFNEKGGAYASCYPDQLLTWCSDEKDECLSDYILRNLKDFLQQSSTKNEESEDSDTDEKEMLEPNINALSAGLTPRHRIFSLAIAPNIPENQLKTAIRSYGRGVKRSEVLACINYNVRGKWEGIIITAKALYSKSSDGDKSRIEFTPQTMFRPEGKYIVINDNNIGSFGMLNANSVSNFCRMMNNFISPGSGGDLEDGQDDEVTSAQCPAEIPRENPTNENEETPDALTETIRAAENGDWKKVGKIVGKGIWNTFKENVEDTRRFRNEFENLSPYELAAICKNTWKSSTERAAAFHVLKMKVPDEGERRQMLR